ncbi:hypothetical protein ACFQ77_19835 [Streptomyces virginiae]|uniref:hypothetical protein n=1 Tax=Streptomyces virginiae TaxID=1961 RepID=UPI0036BCE829
MDLRTFRALLSDEGQSLLAALERVRTTGGGWIRLAPGLGPGVVPDPDSSTVAAPS